MSKLIVIFLILSLTISGDSAGDSRMRLALASCDFVDLTVTGAICGGGRKIKYFKVEPSEIKFETFHL